MPHILAAERKVLRFGSATHEAWVYLNGQEIYHHKGGFTPFEMDITEVAVPGENLLTVRISNMLDHTTLPVGNYSETTDSQGRLKRKMDKTLTFSIMPVSIAPLLYTPPTIILSKIFVLTPNSIMTCHRQRLTFQSIRTN